MEDSITDIEQPGLSSPMLDLIHHFQPLFSRIDASFGQQEGGEPLVEELKHVRRYNEEYRRGLGNEIVLFQNDVGSYITFTVDLVDKFWRMRFDEMILNQVWVQCDWPQKRQTPYLYE